MKKIATVDAVGHVICHDITRIVKDETKDVAFKKGHIVREEDIPALLALGKDHLYIWEKSSGMLHENEAAEQLYSLCANTGLMSTPVKEGKIDVIAEFDGLYRVDVNRLDAINEIGEIIISTRHTNYPARKGDKLAGMRVIPLVIDERRMSEANEIAGDTPLLELLPYKKLRAGIISTGNEIYHGRIKDTFTPVVVEKLAGYGITADCFKVVNDDKTRIIDAIREAHNRVDLIICTGGMSVDPDDLTPGAIRESGAEVICYGAPVLPGAMFMLAYFSDGVPVMGLPGCVMYSRTTIFDLMLPRIAAEVSISRRDITRMGHGGYCLSCKDCRFPNCGFGHGGA